MLERADNGNEFSNFRTSFGLITKFFRSTSPYLFKFADKVTYIIKSAVHGNLQYGKRSVSQKTAGALNAVANKILDGGYSGQLFKEAAQVLGIAGDGVSQVLQGNRFMEMLFHIRDDGLIVADSVLSCCMALLSGRQKHSAFSRQDKKLKKQQLAVDVPSVFSGQGFLKDLIKEGSVLRIFWVIPGKRMGK